jgi:hypothetical protein
VSEVGPNYVVTADAALNADAAFGGDASADAALAGQWVLRPVVRVSEAAIAGAACEDEGRSHGQ